MFYSRAAKRKELERIRDEAIHRAEATYDQELARLYPLTEFKAGEYVQVLANGRMGMVSRYHKTDHKWWVTIFDGTGE